MGAQIQQFTDTQKQHSYVFNQSWQPSRATRDLVRVAGEKHHQDDWYKLHG